MEFFFFFFVYGDSAQFVSLHLTVSCICFSRLVSVRAQKREMASSGVVAASLDAVSESCCLHYVFIFKRLHMHNRVFNIFSFFLLDSETFVFVKMAAKAAAASHDTFPLCVAPRSEQSMQLHSMQI